MSRYAVGCAGQHAMHDDSGGASPLHLTTDDVDEAFAACETGPVGCEVYDRKERAWIGPLCREEIDDAKAMIAARTTYLDAPARSPVKAIKPPDAMTLEEINRAIRASPLRGTYPTTGGPI